MFYHVLPGQKKHVEMWCFTVDDKLVSNLHMYTINPSEIGAIGVIKEVINHVNIQVIRPWRSIESYGDDWGSPFQETFPWM